MKLIYFDVFAGISGDMCLGALVDAGCPPDILRTTLERMLIPGFILNYERVLRGPLSGAKVDVHVEEEHHVHRKLKDVLEIVDRTTWPDPVRERIELTFTELAKAEGHIHNKPYDEIHFHEVGSFDAIVDISGTIFALHHLGIEGFSCSKIHVGEGFAQTRHGKLPIPVPATAHLLQGFETYSTGRPVEMVTPTGAALLKVLAGGSSVMPAMRIERVGYGAGSRNSKDLPNLLRVFIGATDPTNSDWITVIETHIDDMNPEFFEPLLHKLFKTGALDVAISSIQMKKNRPGTLLTVISPVVLREKLSEIILRHSSSIGVRMYNCERRVLQRKETVVRTEWGEIRGKICWGYGVENRFTPEYNDCVEIHKKHDIPIALVYQKAIQSYTQQHGLV